MHHAMPRVTHGERVVDAVSGVTKLQLIEYYAEAGEAMLPHLAGRPVALVRAPGGVTGKAFFQKHADAKHLPQVDPLPASLTPGEAPLLTVASLHSLLAAAQMNVVEFHTWNVTQRAFHQPDRIVFDLDPGEGVAWSDVQEGAGLIRVLIDELGLRNYLKTSGGKGLHVVVPIVPDHDWQVVRRFARAVVERLVRQAPERFVAKSGPANRIGRIFVDYLRNGDGATTAAAWTARVRPGLGVSVPVDWDELPSLSSGAHWTVATAASRLAVGNRPWTSALRLRQRLDRAVSALDAVIAKDGPPSRGSAPAA